MTRRYGRWAGNPNGIAEDPACCIEEISGWPSHLFHQCSRLRGHGPDGKYCKQHAKMLAAREARNARIKEQYG